MLGTRQEVQEIQTAFSTGCVHPPAAPTGARAWGRPTRPEPRALPGCACAPRATGSHLQASERQRGAGLQAAAGRLLRGDGATASGRHNPDGAFPTGLWHNRV